MDNFNQNNNQDSFIGEAPPVSGYATEIPLQPLPLENHSQYSNQARNFYFESQQKFIKKFGAGRQTILIVAALSALNLIITMSDGNIYFPFSLFSTIILTALGSYADSTAVSVIFYAVCAVIIGAIFLVWKLSDKHIGASIAAVVIYGLDTLAFAFLILSDIAALDVSALIDVAFHAWAMASIIFHLSAALALKKMADAAPVGQYIPN